MGLAPAATVNGALVETLNRARNFFSTENHFHSNSKNILVKIGEPEEQQRVLGSSLLIRRYAPHGSELPFSGHCGRG